MSLVRLALALALAAGAAPALAHVEAAGYRLSDAELTLSPGRTTAADLDGADLRPHLELVALADPAGASSAGPAAGGLDFDLLGSAPATAPADEAAARAAKRRRTMLSWHQGVGLALVATELGTTVAGQLNYGDKFGGAAPANTNRYRATHAVLAISTLGLFATNGAIALLAPAPPGRKLQLDRVMVHRISMALATAGMIAQGIYGFRTSGREGYLDQASLGKTHLVLGYATLAAFAVGVGVITF